MPNLIHTNAKVAQKGNRKAELTRKQSLCVFKTSDTVVSKSEKLQTTVR